MLDPINQLKFVILNRLKVGSYYIYFYPEVKLMYFLIPKNASIRKRKTFDYKK